eukprot:TRINITY_DN71750_c0_g1_i1.p1 TRINITY_DN71750_c0_g1~~TRINITY_DN71750_c0_g1_i1.p1  ORF type:complete len:310 (-),score=47.39 TRINITY_DN71750_c0_g1_i1:177-1106(-)
MFAIQGLKGFCRPAVVAARSNSTIAGTVGYRCNYHQPDRLALTCPHENVEWTYGELWGRVQKVAGGLKGLGYQPGSVIATDLNHSASNLLLQLAVAHNGMLLMTLQDKGKLDELSPQVQIDGAVMTGGSSFLAQASFPMKSLDVNDFMKLSGKAIEGATDRNYPLAYYGSATPTSNREVYLYGVGTAGTLEMEPEDQVCVAASLNHPFGIGGAVSAFVRNSTVHLPDMNKIDLKDSTILITDKHKLSSVHDSVKSGCKLRGGLVKVGSGSDLLTDKEQIGDVQLWTLGTGDKIFRPLFDACVDKYYSYK